MINKIRYDMIENDNTAKLSCIVQRSIEMLDIGTIILSKIKNKSIYHYLK